MKKFISCALVVCMVVAMVAMIPMTASAATTRNTGNDLFYKEPTAETPNGKTVSNTGWDAYAGTPTLDGKFTEGEAWENALPLRVNRATTPFINNNATTGWYDGDLYLLWDEDYLYVLEIQREFPWDNLTATWSSVTESNAGNLWTGGYYGTQITVCENEDITQAASLTDAANSTWMHQISYMPITEGKTSAELELNTTYEGVFRIRYGGYSDTAANYQASKVWHTYAELFNADGAYYGIASNLKTYFTKTSDTGCVMETRIPWEFVSRTEGAKAPTEKGIGVKVYMGHSGGSVLADCYGINGDFSGYDPIKLLPKNETVTKPSYSPEIIPDKQYWYDQFKANDPTVGGKTYYISTPEQLLGLSEIIENDAYATINSKAGLSLEKVNDKAYLTRGNTFAFTNDIDLNPGVDWSVANAEWLAVRANKATIPELAKCGNNAVIPSTTFKGLDDFYGIIDGQGYSLKGLYNSNGYKYSDGAADMSVAAGGLIGRLCQGGITNLNVESGFVGTATLAGNVQFGGLIGEVRTENYTDYTVAEGATYANGKIIVSNVNVGTEFTVYRYGTKGSSDTNIYAYAGVIGSIWPGIKNKGAKIEAIFSDIVFSGTMLDNTANDQSRTNLVLGNNFVAETASSVLSNGTTQVDRKISGIVGNVAAEVSAETFTTNRYTTVTIGGDVPAGLVKMTDGTAATVKVADMVADTKWQASAAADGRFYVRFVSEVSIADMNDYEAIGHKITITGKKAGQDDITVEVDLTDNTNVYAGIKADGVTVTADSDKFNVIDGNYLVASIINLPAIDGVTYTATVQTIYKVSETVTITGCAEDLGAIAPLN